LGEANRAKASLARVKAVGWWRGVVVTRLI